MKIRETYNYEAELARPMCEGCNKLHAEGRIMTGYVCTMYNYVAPKMYRDANECPHNNKLRKASSNKVRFGQQKQGGFHG